MIDIFSSSVKIFHQFNHFLGSDGGELLKISFEFLLFIFVSYMVISQYVHCVDRKKHRQLKYLSVSFLTLAFTKLIGTVVAMGVVFGDIPRIWLDSIIPPFEHSIEVFALYLLGVSVAYPLLRVKIKSLRNKVYAGAAALLIAITAFVRNF